MAGLLDFLNTDEARMGLGLLAASGPSSTPMNAFQRIQMAQQGMDSHNQGKLKSKLLQSQIDENAMQNQLRQAQMEGSTARQQAMGTAFDGGQLNIPLLLRAGVPVADIEKMAGFQNFGRPEVARTVEEMRNGAPVVVQYDKYGQPVGQAAPQWKAPLSVDTGGQTNFVDPVTLAARGAFNKTQSPDSLASNATSQRNADMTDARMRETNQGSRLPSGYRQGMNGDLEYIPGGPADPASKAGGGKPLTEGQSKALLFGTRMQESNDILEALEKSGKQISTPGANSGWAIGATVNLLNSSQGRQLDQAKRNFLNAVLRRESGAVISEPEFESGAKQYFPQLGDTAPEIAQKKRAREVATRGILAEVPDSDARVAAVRGPAQQPAEKTAGKSKVVTIDGKQVSAQRAPDGNYYVKQPNGKYAKVVE